VKKEKGFGAMILFFAWDLCGDIMIDHLHICLKTMISNCVCVGVLVFLRILWCSQNGDHSENNLAKFGDMIDMKIGKKKILL
jgi:hypothetical protein